MSKRPPGQYGGSDARYAMFKARLDAWLRDQPVRRDARVDALVETLCRHFAEQPVARLLAAALPEHVRCTLVADPDRRGRLPRAIRHVLEYGPWFWEVDLAVAASVRFEPSHEVLSGDVLLLEAAAAGPAVLEDARAEHDRGRRVLVLADTGSPVALPPELPVCWYDGAAFDEGEVAGFERQLRDAATRVFDGVRGQNPFVGYRHASDAGVAPIPALQRMHARFPNPGVLVYAEPAELVRQCGVSPSAAARVCGLVRERFAMHRASRGAHG